MLSRLRIVNFALLREAEIAFLPGFTAITGETGAGKSLFVGALSFLAGERTGVEMLRDGAAKAIVEAEFARSGGETERLRRELAADGRSRAFIDDSPVSLKELAHRAGSLIDITAQRAYSHLLDPDRHLDFLDDFAHLAEQRRLMARYEADYDELQRRIARLEKQRDAFLRQRELVEFQLAEINATDPHPGEDDELAAEVRRLEHYEELQNNARILEELLLTGESAVEPLLAQVEPVLERIAGIDDEVKPLLQEFISARLTLREAARTVIDRCRRSSFEAEKLESSRERQYRIAGLARKFGGTLTAVLERRERLNKELQTGDATEDEIKRQTAEREQLVAQWSHLALQVGESRHKAAWNLSDRVVAALAKLGVPKAIFQIDLPLRAAANGLFVKDGKRFKLDACGLEQAQFLLSVNPGLEPRPVNQVASGGELSRLLLALKEVLPVGSREATILFDEIDVGVSGRIAEMVGRKLKELAKGRQLMAITHLPQIAGLADHHLSVAKHQGKTGTEAEIIELTGEARVAAVAALISGGKVTDAALAQARNLIPNS